MAPQSNADAPRELFGVERLDRLLLGCSGRSAAASVDCIRSDVAAFTANAPPKDDQTLIAMRCT